MHFGHIVAPGNKDIGMIDVVIAAHGLVQTETGQKSGYRTGHAETGVGFHIVGADTAFEQLGGCIPVGNRPLPGPVHGDGILSVALDRLFHFLGHQIEGLFDGNLDQLSVFADQGLSYSVFAIKNLNGMIAFYAAQPLVDRTVGIAFYGHCPIAGNTRPEGRIRCRKIGRASFSIQSSPKMDLNFSKRRN